MAILHLEWNEHKVWREKIHGIVRLLQPAQFHIARAFVVNLCGPEISNHVGSYGTITRQHQLILRF